MFFLFAITLCSCKKEQTEITVYEIDSPVNADLRSLYRKSEDTLYCTGGSEKSGVILASTDKGVSWHVIYSNLPEKINDVAWFNDLMVTAGDNFRVFKKGNNNLWDEYWITTFVTLNYHTHLLDIEIVNDSTLVFCGGMELGRGIIGRTADYGNSWQLFPYDHELRAVKFFDNQNGICCGNGVLLRTTDGGNSWQLNDAQNRFWTNGFIQNNSYYACSYRGEVIRANYPGSNFHYLNKVKSVFRNDGYLTTLSTFDGKHIISCGNKGDCIVSYDSGSTWKKVKSFGNSYINNVLMLTATTGLVVGNGGKIFYFAL